jgi:hypothetical protein
MTRRTNVGKTGHASDKSGIYLARCCEYEIVVSKGDVFPLCRKCNSLTRWKLVKSAVQADAPVWTPVSTLW